MESAVIFNLVSWALSSSPAFGAAVQAWASHALLPLSWPQALASTLINTLWQGAAIACGLALCMRFTPKIPARLRYGIWAAGFAALVCLPLLPALIESLAPPSFNAAPAHPAALAAGSTANVWSAAGPVARPLLSLDARWSLGLAALWIAASLLRSASLAAHALRMRRLWRSAANVEALLQSAAACSAQSAAARSAELCATSDLDRPCVIGFFRPRILIPAWLLSRLNPAELEHVVLHESEHLRRRDDWANLVQKLCLVVFPLNPALWWLERRLCAEREMACDDGVVRRTQAPRTYAACLAGLAERGLEHRAAVLSLGAWQHRPELAARVQRLLRRPQVLSPVASAASVVLVGCGLVAGVVALAHSPQLVAFVAQSNPAAKSLRASASNIEPSLEGDAVADFSPKAIAFAGSGAQPYRAVKTMAILPPARTTSSLRNNNSTRNTKSPGAMNPDNNSIGSGHSLASLVPKAIAARMRDQQAPQGTGAQASQTSASLTGSADRGPNQTGYLVLTTFEEVQTTGRNEGVQGDEVAGEIAAGSAGAGASSVGSEPSARITVTRLVLRFVQPASNFPADSNSQPAPTVPQASNIQPGANVPPASNPVQPASNSTQPIAIPYRDGWIVIQL
jgi:beta-lactamase regulating signal transducer with metallopeptidase domain